MAQTSKIQRSKVEVELDQRSPSEGVIEAFTRIEGCDPLELDFTLFNWIAVDALDQLFEQTPDESAIDLNFTVDGRRVVIHDNKVSVQPD